MRRSSCSELTGQSPTLLSRGNCQPGQQNAGSHRSCQNQSAVTVKQHTKGTVPEKPSPSEPVNWMERLNQMKPVGDAEQNSEAFVVQEHLIRVYLPGGGTHRIRGALCTGQHFACRQHQIEDKSKTGRLSSWKIKRQTVIPTGGQRVKFR